MKKVILIGASGFLGRHVLQELLEQEFNVYATQYNTQLDDEGITLIYGGTKVLKRKLIDTIQPDVIIHCARPVMPKLKRLGRYWAALVAYRNNRRLLKRLDRSNSRPLLVFASGSLMYGNSPTAHNEDAPLNPISYARQYQRGEKPIRKAIDDGDYPVAMLRFPWLLGNGSWFKWFFLGTAEDYLALPMFGDGKNKMEIMDVKDAAKLMVLYAKAGKKGIYNIYDKAITQQEFVDAVSEEVKLRVKDYQEIFDESLEKETLEAFTSNILLKSKHPEVLKSFKFKPLQESLDEIVRNA